MKSVLILRHAKSSWKHPNIYDHDRPLNKGKRDVPIMVELLNEHLIPDLIISSTAKRGSEINSIRELVLHLKKEGITPSYAPRMSD